MIPEASLTSPTAYADLDKRTRKGMTIIIAYPIVVCLVSLALNTFVFDAQSMVVALPSTESIQALIVAAVLLTINHTWLMTATELTRARYKLFATPEEWSASGTKAQDASPDGLRELARHHNAHRNATENTACFIHAYGYLSRSDNTRGLFMTVGLLAMYGLGSHLVLGLV